MLAEEMKEALKNLEDAEHALAIQKDWLRRAEKRVRECQAKIAALVKPAAEQKEESVKPLFSPAATDKLNHISGSGHDITDLQKRFVDYLNEHGTPGEWLDTFAMCHSTFAWKQFGKHLVDPTLKAMAEANIVEFDCISSTGFPSSIRLKTHVTAPKI